MSDAQLLYDHPQDGPTITNIETYHTQANGTLVAALPDGGQILLSGAMDWMVIDQ